MNRITNPTANNKSAYQDTPFMSVIWAIDQAIKLGNGQLFEENQPTLDQLKDKV